MSEELYPVISIRDPAIDREQTTEGDLLAYVQQHRDIAKLKIKPDVAPTIYYVREIPHHMWGRFFSFNGTDSDITNAFQACVMEVKNAKRNDGAYVEGGVSCARMKDSELMSFETMSRFIKQPFGPLIVAEIGLFAYERSAFQSATGESYREPPSCREFLARQTFRPAGSSPNTQVQSSD
jgi:hypothetical protein